MTSCVSNHDFSLQGLSPFACSFGVVQEEVASPLAWDEDCDSAINSNDIAILGLGDQFLF